MSRRASGEQKEAKANGRRAPVAKMEKLVGLRRANQPELFSVGPTNGRSEAHAEGKDHLHRRIAERAYMLYERSGFQDGKDLEHWLEAERQVKGVRGQAA